MFEYFAVLHVVASSAAEPASWAAAATCELANRQMTFTFQVSGFPASQGTRERPSNHFPSDRLRPSGFLFQRLSVLIQRYNAILLHITAGYYYYYFDPGTLFPRNEKNYSMQYKKSTKIKLE